MIYIALLSIGLAIYFYSIKFLDAPISGGVRLLLTSFRIVFLLALLYLLTNPIVQESKEEKRSPALYIAIDDSQSMSYPIDPTEDAESTSRWIHTINQVRNDLLPLWQETGYETYFTLFSQTKNTGSGNSQWYADFPVQATPSSSSTDIASVIDSYAQKQSNHQAAYLLLFSDGQWNVGKNPQLAARSIQTATDVNSLAQPHIYTFGIGTVEETFDIIVDQIQTPPQIRAGESLSLTVNTLIRGTKSDGQAKVRLRVAGEDNTEHFFAEKTFEWDNESTEFYIPFNIPDLDEGDYLIHSEIDPFPGEIFTTNNTKTTGVRVLKNQDNILILTSSPDWDMKFLKRSFENQPYLSVQTYLTKGNEIHPLGDRAWVEEQISQQPDINQEDFPQQKEDLAELLETISVVVLYNYKFEVADFTEALQNYIEEGGSVLFYPGNQNAQVPPTDLFERIPPPMRQKYNLVTRELMVQPASMAVPAIQKSLASLSDTTSLPPVGPLYMPEDNVIAGNILMHGVLPGGGSLPLIVLQRYGLGRILTITSHSFWRWQFHSEESIFPNFWLSILYESKPQLQMDAGRLYTDRYLYELYQPVNIFYEALDSDNVPSTGFSVAIQTPNGTDNVWLNPSNQVEGQFQAQYTPTSAGEYSIRSTLVDENKAFYVEENLQEIKQLTQNIALLQAIAQDTGGRYGNLPAWRQVAEDIPESILLYENITSRFVGEFWWVAVVLVLFLGSEWFIRWRQGLP